MIRLEGVSAGYGRRAVLRDLHLSLSSGEMVGLLGPNGSGKSTLLMTLSGVLPPQSGRILIDGRPADRLSPRETARRLASVPQRAAPTFELPVLSLVLMGRYPYLKFLGGYTDTDRAAAMAAMRETRTEAFAGRLSGELSGGEFQRVLIARALAQEAPVILLDEAASGLDVARKVEIYDLLRAKNRTGATILSAVHDLNLAALYFDRLVFLKNGRIVKDGLVQDVFTRDVLMEIYETPLALSPHPVTGVPQAHLVPGPRLGR